jgi:4-hydroxybenzoyl-CoA reductase subunit gamma
MKRLVSLTVNGIARQEALESTELLIDFLRDGLGLTGTKMGCDGGDCGNGSSPNVVLKLVHSAK